MPFMESEEKYPILDKEFYVLAARKRVPAGLPYTADTLLLKRTINPWHISQRLCESTVVKWLCDRLTGCTSTPSETRLSKGALTWAVAHSAGYLQHSVLPLLTFATISVCFLNCVFPTM